MPGFNRVDVKLGAAAWIGRSSTESWNTSEFGDFPHSSSKFEASQWVDGSLDSYQGATSKAQLRSEVWPIRTKANGLVPITDPQEFSYMKISSDGFDNGQWATTNPGNQFSPDDVFYPYKAAFGIAEIDLGSDFGVSTSANLTVNPVNDDATGEPLIEIHGDPADEISTAPEPLG